MATIEPILLRIEIRNRASRELKKVEVDMKNVDTASARASGGTERLGTSFTNLAKAAVGAFAVGQVAGFIKDVSVEAAKAEAATTSLRLQVGELSNSLMIDLRSASRGTVSDLNLVNAANRALALGIEENQIVPLMEVARARAREMGITVTQAFDDIVTGIGRQSPLILDNLGIVGVSGAFDMFAEKAGKAREELDDFEKKQALVNFVIENSKDVIERQSQVTETNIDKIEQLTAAWQNLRVEVGEAAVPAITTAIESLSDAFGFLNRGAGFVSQDRIEELTKQFGQNTLLTTAEFIEINARNRAEERLLMDAIGENARAHDEYALTLRKVRDAQQDNVITLNEAIPLIREGTIDMNNLDSSFQSFIQSATGSQNEALRFAFSMKELSEAMKPVEEQANTTSESINKNASSLRNGFDRSQAQIRAFEIKARGDGRLSSFQEGTSKSPKKNIGLFRDTVKLQEKQLTVIKEISKVDTGRLGTADSLMMTTEQTKTLTLQLKESTEEHFTIIETKGPGVASNLERQADAAERIASAEERAARAVRARLQALSSEGEVDLTNASINTLITTQNRGSGRR